MTTPTTIPEAVRRAAEAFSSRPAVRDADGHWLDYRELAEGVRAAAAALLAHDVEPGDRVAVWAPNGVPWLLAALGAQYIGAVLVPLNTRYRGEAADVLARSGAKLLVVDQGFLGTDHLALLREAADSDTGPEPRPVPGLPALRTVVSLGDDVPGAVSWKAFLAAARPEHREQAERLADAVTPVTVADVLYTSGTTGRPKGAVAGHRQTLEVAGSWAEPAGVGPEDRYLVMNPFFHSFGSKAGYLVCLVTGAACLPVPVFDAGAVLDLVDAERITILPGPPTLFTSLLDRPDGADRLASLRLAVTGAAIVPEALITRMRSELGIPVVLTAYGLTEAPVVTMSTPDDDAHTVATTCGRPARHTEIRIQPDGELLVRSPQVMTGYLDDLEATAAAIDAEGWLHTGDLATLDDAGYLRITDRLKDMFTVGGFNVYPAEVERVLAGHPDVLESAVVGVPDERLGEVPVAFVVPRAGRSPEPDDVTAFCRARLANFKVPRTVTVVPALPRNAGGKVLKTELRHAL
jgi:HIP---CoA ligase